MDGFFKSSFSPISEKAYTIFLHVIEGLGLYPTGYDQDRDKVILHAMLNDGAIETESKIGQTGQMGQGSTVFNSNCVWNRDSLNEIKRMKTDCRSVKLELFMRTERLEGRATKPIGSLVMPLRCAPTITDMHEMQSKLQWHKLTIVQPEWRLHKPEICLALVIAKTSLVYSLGFSSMLSRIKPVDYCMTSPLSPGIRETAGMLMSQKGVHVKYLNEINRIQVGNDPNVDCQFIRVSVNLRNVKNLAKLFEFAPRDLVSRGQFVFQYFFLDSHANVEIPTSMVTDCNFLNERLSIDFRSSLRSLEAYFKRLFYIPISLHLNDTLIGTFQLGFSNIFPNEEFFNTQKVWEVNSTFFFERNHRFTSPHPDGPCVDYSFDLEFIYEDPVKHVHVDTSKSPPPAIKQNTLKTVIYNDGAKHRQLVKVMVVPKQQIEKSTPIEVAQQRQLEQPVSIGVARQQQLEQPVSIEVAQQQPLEQPVSKEVARQQQLEQPVSTEVRKMLVEKTVLEEASVYGISTHSNSCPTENLALETDSTQSKKQKAPEVNHTESDRPKWLQEYKDEMTRKIQALELSVREMKEKVENDARVHMEKQREAQLEIARLEQESLCLKEHVEKSESKMMENPKTGNVGDIDKESAQEIINDERVLKSDSEEKGFLEKTRTNDVVQRESQQEMARLQQENVYLKVRVEELDAKMNEILKLNCIRNIETRPAPDGLEKVTQQERVVESDLNVNDGFEKVHLREEEQQAAQRKIARLQQENACLKQRFEESNAKMKELLATNSNFNTNPRADHKTVDKYEHRDSVLQLDSTEKDIAEEARVHDAEQRAAQRQIARLRKENTLLKQRVEESDTNVKNILRMRSVQLSETRVVKESMIVSEYAEKQKMRKNIARPERRQEADTKMKDNFEANVSVQDMKLQADQQEVDRLKQAIAELQERLEESEAKIKKILDYPRTNEAKQAEAEEELKSLKQENVELNKRVVESEAKVKQLQQENKVHEVKKRESQKELSKLKRQNRELKERMLDLEQLLSQSSSKAQIQEMLTAMRSEVNNYYKHELKKTKKALLSLKSTAIMKQKKDLTVSRQKIDNLAVSNDLSTVTKVTGSSTDQVIGGDNISIKTEVESARVHTDCDYWSTCPADNDESSTESGEM